jgi:hypothetical protein
MTAEMRRVLRVNRQLADLGHTDIINALDELKTLRAERDRLAQGGDAVATVVDHWTHQLQSPHSNIIEFSDDAQKLPIGTKLYTAPAPAGEDAARLDALGDRRVLDALDYDSRTGLWDFVPIDAGLSRSDLTAREAIDAAAGYARASRAAIDAAAAKEGM